jgi:hypothetical protein
MKRFDLLQGNRHRDRLLMSDVRRLAIGLPMTWIKHRPVLGMDIEVETPVAKTWNLRSKENSSSAMTAGGPIAFANTKSGMA